MLNRNGVQPYWGPTTFAKTDAALDASNSNSYTFSALSIGVANADRLIVVCGQFVQSAQTGVTVTIGGISATVITENQGGALYPFIAWAKVPTGTTANVVVTRIDAGSTPQFCAVTLYRVITSTSGPIDSDMTPPATTALSLTGLDARDGGLILWSYQNNDGGVVSVAWDGIDSAVTESDATSESRRVAAGYVDVSENTTARALETGTSTNNQLMSAVSIIP